jgi:hypothetical protein
MWYLSWYYQYCDFVAGETWLRDSPNCKNESNYHTKCSQAHGILRVIQSHLLQLSQRVSINFAEFYWLDFISRLLKNCVDKKNQLDVTFCILYFSSNSCSTCFGQPCAHHQELRYEPVHGRTNCQPDLTTSLQPRDIPTRGYNITQSSAPDDGHMVARNMLGNY